MIDVVHFGDARYQSLTADIELKRGSARLWKILASVGGWDVKLPDATLMKLGGIQFILWNASSTALFNLVNNGGTLVKQVGSDKGVVVSLAGQADANGVWTTLLLDVV